MPRPPIDKHAAVRKQPIRWGGFDESGYEAWYQCEKCGKECYTEFEEEIGSYCAECGVLCGSCCKAQRSPICGPCVRKRWENGKIKETFTASRFPTDEEVRKSEEK